MYFLSGLKYYVFYLDMSSLIQLSKQNEHAAISSLFVDFPLSAKEPFTLFSF